jgi:hypothetical protein
MYIGNRLDRASKRNFVIPLTVSRFHVQNDPCERTLHGIAPPGAFIDATKIF